MLDFGFRGMDKTIGRWGQVDPLAEAYPLISSYAYVANNPLKFIDPDGMRIDSSYTINLDTGETTTTGDEGGDDYDVLHFVNNTPLPREGAIDHVEKVDVQEIYVQGGESPQGTIARGPGYKIIDIGTGGAISPVDDPFTSLEVGAFLKVATLLTGLGMMLDDFGSSAMTTVGRWMSQQEYDIMVSTGRMVEGAGGQTFVATGGPGAFTSAAKGSVYAEFQVASRSLLQGGQSNWYKAIGPNAGRAMQRALQKKGGQLLPRVENISPVLQIK